ncbi:MAG: futalosine hydrolase [Ginsengibacter sp.]
MKVLIVAATQFEIEPFLQRNATTDFLITGIGIPATIFHLTNKLLEKNYDLVINAGIAGSFNDKISLAEVVFVKEDTFGDIGILENGNFNTLFESGFGNANDFPFTNGGLINNNADAAKLNLPFAKAITVNRITDNVLELNNMQQKFSADIESMEGAAFHYVCLQKKISFLQIRAISNRVGERNKDNWEMKLAIRNLNNELLKLINE